MEQVIFYGDKTNGQAGTLVEQVIFYGNKTNGLMEKKGEHGDKINGQN